MRTARAAVRRDRGKARSKDVPAAVAFFDDGVDACFAHLRLRAAHRPVTRTTNSLTRLFDALHEESNAKFDERHAPPPLASASRSGSDGKQGT